MSDFQLTPGNRRIIPQLSDFGSPLELFDLVSELNGIDRQVARKQSLIDQTSSRIRADIESTCLRHLQYYLGLLNIAGVQRHFLTQVALPQSGNAVLNRIDESIENEKALAKTSLDVLTVSLRSNYTARIMAGRKAELEGLPYNSDLFDPKDSPVGEGAFEIYRRATVLEASKNLKEAEAMYSRAIQAAPGFSLALRGYARLAGRRDPATAAACYSAALEDIPRPSYGRTDTGFFGTNLESEVTYRAFRILTLKDEAIAVPAILGGVDFSKRALRSRLHRFAGLFLLRIRLRLRRKAELNALSGERSQTPRTGLVVDIKRMLRPYVRSAAPLYRVFVTPARSAMARIGAHKSVGRRLAGANLRRTGIWALSLNKDLFDFVLVDANADRLKAQIDMVHARWLRVDPQ